MEHPGMGMMPGMMAGMMPPAGGGGAAGNVQAPAAGGQQVAGAGAGAAGAGGTGNQAAAPGNFPQMNPFMNPMMMAAAAGAGKNVLEGDECAVYRKVQSKKV